jgi:hypothetical protein
MVRHVNRHQWDQSLIKKKGGTKSRKAGPSTVDE